MRSPSLAEEDEDEDEDEDELRRGGDTASYRTGRVGRATRRESQLMGLPRVLWELANRFPGAFIQGIDGAKPSKAIGVRE